MARKYPAIPVPTTDPAALQTSLAAVKENVEILTQQRGDRTSSAVTWQDLLDLGLISKTQMPRNPSASG